MLLEVSRHRLEVEGPTVLLGQRRGGHETVGVVEGCPAQPVDVVLGQILFSHRSGELGRIVRDRRRQLQVDGVAGAVVLDVGVDVPVHQGLAGEIGSPEVDVVLDRGAGGLEGDLEDVAQDQLLVEVLRSHRDGGAGEVVLGERGRLPRAGGRVGGGVRRRGLGPGGVARPGRVGAVHRGGGVVAATGGSDQHQQRHHSEVAPVSAQSIHDFLLG